MFPVVRPRPSEFRYVEDGVVIKPPLESPNAVKLCINDFKFSMDIVSMKRYISDPESILVVYLPD